MTFEDSILTALNLHFNAVRISSQLDVGVDGILSLKGDSNIKAYICIQKNLNDNTLSHIIHSTNKLVSQDKLSKIPIIIFKQVAGNTMFGILSYWDFDRYFVNNQINWREYNIQNINWLITQISIRRGSIKLLDSSMCRVVKTIYLNHDDIIDGEIKYLRSFRETYKMKDTSMLSEEDRLMRLIHGTPEDDYPQDELDKVLYHKVVNTYPNAKVKSNLLLFDTELLDLRFLKERKLILFHMNFTPIVYSDSGIPQNTSISNNNLIMELYYTPNFFRETNILPINQIVQLMDNDFINTIKDTYQPLSAINI